MSTCKVVETDDHPRADKTLPQVLQARASKYPTRVDTPHTTLLAFTSQNLRQPSTARLRHLAQCALTLLQTCLEAKLPPK